MVRVRWSFPGVPALVPISSSCWDHSGDKSNFPTSSSRDKLSLTALGGAGKAGSPLGAAKTPVPQSTARCSAPVSPGCVMWGERSALRPSGMEHGNRWGDCPTGTPTAEWVSLPKAAGG